MITRPSKYARPRKELDAADLIAKTGPEKLAHAVAGEEPIRAALLAKMAEGAGDAYLVVGGSHASQGQIEAFRRLVEVPASYTHVMVEVLAADGHWSGLPDAEQLGATSALDAYLGTGSAASFAALRAAHEASDYVAWKLGYAPVVLDLAVAARAGAFRLLPADMAPAMKVRLADLGEALLDVRELHAALTLRAALAGDRPRAKVAMLWGDAHAGQGGVGRFLPRDATVVTVHLLGARDGAAAPEKKLEGKVILDAPVLFPANAAGDELALLLPDAHTRGDVDRAKLADAPAGDAQGAQVSLVCDAGAKLYLGDAVHELGPKPTALRLPAGSVTYVVDANGVLVVGALELVAGEAASVTFDPKRRETRIEHHVPKPAPAGATKGSP